MIRVERHKEVRPGIWRYTVPGFGIEGRSRQPLLDACRQIRAILGDTSHRAGLFREGRTEADITCPVNKGALITVEDGPKGIRFRKYREFDRLAALTSRRRPNEREAAAHPQVHGAPTGLHHHRRDEPAVFRRGSTTRAAGMRGG